MKYRSLAAAGLLQGAVICACGGNDENSLSTGGAPNLGGAPTGGGAGSSTGGVIAKGGSGGTSATAGASGLGKFSFFVTSVNAMKGLSQSDQGFGGDLRFGETGEGAGLRGADKICARIAETAMPGSSVKGWKAFLSASAGGPDGAVVHAKDRIGQGPWYDRTGRLLAQNLTDLLQIRPMGADPAIINDLPNENGVPNHSDNAPGCTANACPDNHDVLTGSDTAGALYTRGTNPTCDDWTSAVGSAGRPRCGHSWPRGTQSWISVLDEAGCAPGINLVEMGPPNTSNPTVGSGGGYGAIYCFALSP
jgi:hypothetical protein